MKKLLAICRQDLKTHRVGFFLLGLTIFFFILRFPSLFEPYWYGDEGIYQIVGRALGEGRVLYEGIWDNKPPILYLIYALVNGDLFSVRLIATVVAILTLLAFFQLSKCLFKKRGALYGATILFTVLFGLPLLEGNIANAENFMLLPIIVSALLIVKASQGKKERRNFQFIIAGLLLAIAFLIKTVVIFDLAAFILFLFFITMPTLHLLFKKRNFLIGIKKLSQQYIPLVGGFTVPVVSVILLFLASGTFSDFLTATFSQGVSYVSYGNEFIVPQGLLFIKLLLLACFIVVLFVFRRSFTNVQIFIMLWLSFSLFNAFFAQRPYTHYLLVLLPSFSLLVGEIIEPKAYRFTGLLILLFILSLIPRNFWIYGKIGPYYQNFISFVTGGKEVEEYVAFFDPNVPSYYEAAQFIRMHTQEDEHIFIWGDAAQVYVLSNKLPPGRLAVSYHITFYPEAFEETKKILAKTRPRYIVLISPIGEYGELLRDYTLRFVLSKGAIIYEREF